MHILTPHISCVVNEQEFDEAVKSYADIYITNTFGTIMRHIRLKGGRYIRYEVKDIPGLDKDKAFPSIKEEINFLPNGKVPGHMLDQIVQFFREVMNVKKADEEAMAHILWNEKDKDSQNKGYRIAIPNQTVSKASVRYEHDHIEPTDLIILDIHSHNTMGAWFSGTDDNDDKKGIFFSGVVGNLDKMEPGFDWRFNINETKVKNVKVTDIFDIPKVEIKIPMEWLERVKTQTYTYTQGGYPQGKILSPVGGWAERNARSCSNNNESWRAGDYSSNNNPGLSKHWEAGCPDLYDDINPGYMSGYDHVNRRHESANSSTKEEPKQQRIIINSSNNLRPVEVKRLANNGITVEEADRSGLFNESREYVEIAAQFDKDTAEAYQQICLYLPELENKDELLTNIMAMCYQSLSHKGQEKLDRQGIK